MPATASTLSSDMEMSASTIWTTAWRTVLAGVLAMACAVAFLGRPALGAQLAPQLPADPEQQQAAGQRQPDDLQQLGGDDGEQDAQARRGQDAQHEHPGALAFGQAGGDKADDDGVVAGQHQVDQDDLDERAQFGEGNHRRQVTSSVEERGGQGRAMSIPCPGPAPQRQVADGLYWRLISIPR